MGETKRRLNRLKGKTMNNQMLVFGDPQHEMPAACGKRSVRRCGVAVLRRNHFSLARFFAKAGHRRKILVVDDEALAREACSEALQNAGMEAVCAETCGEIMGKMEEQHPEALLLDIELTDDNGLNFLPKFKARYPDVPVVMFTGLGYDESLMESALANGAAGYVSKGTSIENLIATLKNVCRKP